MSKKVVALLLMITGLCIIVAFAIITYLNSRKPTAGLKVESNVDALVFVDNQQIGSAPVDKMFRPGEVTVKIIPSTTSDALTTFQTKVKLESKVYTVIKQEFGTTDAESAGETIALVPQSGKTASLSIVTSSPETASVTVDGQPQGFTPLIVPSLPAGSHQVVVSAPGYTSRTIAAQTVAGYKLVLTVKLATTATQPTPTPTIDPVATPSATPKVSGTPAPTAKLTVAPTPTTAAKTTTTPTPSKAASTTPTPAMAKPYVTIGSTPVGFLRVRQGPSTGSAEIGQVKPGESYSLLGSETGWYQIKVQLDATSSGWISSQYATKTE